MFIDETRRVELELHKLQTSLSDRLLGDCLNLNWSDIAGLDAAKEATKLSIILPMKFPHLFYRETRSGITRPLLLCGPSGSGKTALARAIAVECKATFCCMSSRDPGLREEPETWVAYPSTEAPMLTAEQFHPITLPVCRGTQALTYLCR